MPSRELGPNLSETMSFAEDLDYTIDLLPWPDTSEETFTIIGPTGIHARLDTDREVRKFIWHRMRHQYLLWTIRRTNELQIKINVFLRRRGFSPQFRPSEGLWVYQNENHNPCGVLWISDILAVTDTFDEYLQMRSTRRHPHTSNPLPFEGSLENEFFSRTYKP